MSTSSTLRGPTMYFSDPAGDGNVDNRNDKINYNDKDVNNLPIGLVDCVDCRCSIIGQVPRAVEASA